MRSSRNVHCLESEAENRRANSRTFIEKLRAIKWGFIFKRVLAISIGVPIITVVGLCPAVGRPLYDWLLFHPMKYPLGEYVHTTVNGITPTDVYFQSASGKKLHGFMYNALGAKRVFLFSHGNGANMTWRAQLAGILTRTGNSVFAYDYAGYGRSEGSPSEQGICQDARGAYDYLISQGYGPKQIILFGESLGTVVTGNLASSVDCAGVVLQCPIYSMRRIGCDLMPFLKKYPTWAWTDEERQLDNSVAVTKIHVPLLIVGGTADTLTPVRYSDDLFALASAPKHYARIQGAGHGDRVMTTAPEYNLQLREFLQDLN